MLNFLYAFSTSKKHWKILVITAVIIELISLYLQHVHSLKPCVLCIYQRCALLGIIASGITMLIFSFNILKFLSLPVWIFSAWKGLLLAKQHVNAQLYPSPFSTCDLFVNFPNYLPLNKWFPFIFNSYGTCFEHQWYFLSLEISQWMVIIFSIYLIDSIFIFIIELYIFFKKFF